MIEIAIVIALCQSTGVCTDNTIEALEELKENPIIMEVEPAPSPKPSVYRGMGNGGSDVERWRSLVAEYFPNEVELALCVMRGESGGNPNAKNRKSTARGLFQILGSLWAPHFGVSYNDLYDPYLNVRLAAKIRQSQGWTAWSVYNRGKC